MCLSFRAHKDSFDRSGHTYVAMDAHKKYIEITNCGFEVHSLW